ncbi:MAG TPA: polyphosphate kinase 2 family protein [Vicinamibacterales bacterium]|nr:polyphosphate kinase 2 family protein [Vicinamibacterales bacterium]
MNVDQFRARPGDRSAMTRIRPGERHGLDKRGAAEHLADSLTRLKARQEVLYANGRAALLLIFQGLDAAGKDSAIEHVMSGVNPQGTDVHSFKAPSAEEQAHDYLWRASRALPARGRIGIFNRSYYEELLVVRVHEPLLAAEPLPPWCASPAIWKQRFEDINAFERYLSRNGTVIRKFFLYVSRKTQRKRLLERLDDPAKNWKFQLGDLAERALWRDYMRAYRDVLAETSTKHAPWYVVPADHKWFAHLVISRVIVETLESLDISFPTVTDANRRALAQARSRLLRDR